jgi:UDP-N-acetylmuramoylalanine-D-glutamate ligase
MTILILGFGKSGRATYKFLTEKLNIQNILVSDDNYAALDCLPVNHIVSTKMLDAFEYEKQSNLQTYNSHLKTSGASLITDDFTNSISILVASPGVPFNHVIFMWAIANGVKISSDIEIFFQIIKGDILEYLDANNKDICNDITIENSTSNGKNQLNCSALCKSQKNGLDSTVVNNDQFINTSIHTINETNSDGNKQAYPHIICITGTNGKSTTTQLIQHLCGDEYVVCGNIGIPVLSLSYPFNAKGYVIELSSFQMEIMNSFHLIDIGVLMNITPDHLDRYVTIEKYIEVKSLICGAQQVIICGEDEYCKNIYNASIESGLNVHKLFFCDTNSKSFSSAPNSQSFSQSNNRRYRVSEDAKDAVILFSPACESFDQYKNFEDRGRRFKEEILQTIIDSNHKI